jgi:hypothetical protein
MDDNGCKMMTIPHMNMCLGLIAKTYMARNRLNASVTFIGRGTSLSNLNLPNKRTTKM